LVVPLFILQFSKIGSDYIAAIIIIVGFLASHLLWNVGYAAIGGLVGSLTQMPDERTIMSSSRAQGMSIGKLIFSVTGPFMVMFFAARVGDVIGFAITIAIFGILMILGYFYIYRITAVADSRESNVTDTQIKKSGKTVREIAVLVFKNRPLLLILIAETFRNTCLFLVLSFAFYYFGYVLKNPGFLSVFILVTGVFSLFGTVIATWIGVKIGKRNTYWISLIASAFVFLSAAFIGTNTWSFTIIFAIALMLVMVPQAMNTALFVDTATYGEWKTGKNIQAFIMSLLMLPIKFGLLIRSAIIAVGLMSIGYIAGTTPSQEVVNGIRSIMIYSPAVTSAIAGAICYLGYRIEEKDVLRMQKEIAAR
jgi:Na+/melibiose symporter-like transporter